MRLITLLLCTIGLLCVALLIVLFGQLPSYRGIIIYRLRNWLVDDLYHRIIVPIMNHIDEKLFNMKMGEFLHGTLFTWALGWIVPLFYVGILSTALCFFFKYVYPVYYTHKYIVSTPDQLGFANFQFYLIIIPSILVNYLSFGLTVFTNPGSLKEILKSPKLNKSALLKQFPYDTMIFSQQDSQCSTCHISKLPRSKHCSVCDQCYLLFDHHCIWVNNCIGYYNFKYFMVFVLSSIWIFIYGGYLSWSTLSYSMAQYYNLVLNSNASDLANPPISYNSLILNILSKCKSGSIGNGLNIGLSNYFMIYWKLITRTNITNETSGVIMILCVCLFPLVAFFFLENVKNMYLGVTTNETAKWGFINEVLQLGILYKLIPYSKNTEVAYLTLEMSSSGESHFFKLSDDSAVTEEFLKSGKLVKIQGWEELENIYDKGFYQNVKERFLTKDFYKL